MESILFAFGMLGLLMVVGFAYLWQGRLQMSEPVISYGIEESIAFVTDRLSDETRQHIGPRSVRRILEWEMRYLQSEIAADPEHPVVVGSEEAAIYAQQQLLRTGFEYDGAVIMEVLGLQGEYLASIGALAGEVGAEEPSRPDERAGN